MADNSLGFAVSKVLSGTPGEVYKVLGNGLIPFLAADGQIYVIDWLGHIQPLGDLIDTGGTASVISFTVGEASYWENNILKSSGSPGENIGGTDSVTLSDFAGGVILQVSLGGLNAAQNQYSWASPTLTLGAGMQFNDGDVVIIMGETKAGSGGGGGGSTASVVYSEQIIATDGQTQFPALPSTDLQKANTTLFFWEGSLLFYGADNDYLNTPSNGYVTLNFAATGGNRFRLVGLNVS